MPDERNKLQGQQGEEDRSQNAPGRNQADNQSLGGKAGDQDRRGDPSQGVNDMKREDGDHKEGGQNETRQ